MGGARSEVHDGTTRVLLEAATWVRPEHPAHVDAARRCAARRSARFEKGLAPEQAIDAQAVATRLMLELCGAQLAPGTLDVGGRPARRRKRSACATRA